MWGRAGTGPRLGPLSPTRLVPPRFRRGSTRSSSGETRIGSDFQRWLGRPNPRREGFSESPVEEGRSGVMPGSSLPLSSGVRTSSHPHHLSDNVPRPLSCQMTQTIPPRVLNLLGTGPLTLTNPGLSGSGSRENYEYREHGGTKGDGSGAPQGGWKDKHHPRPCAVPIRSRGWTLGPPGRFGPGQTPMPTPCAAAPS